MNIITTVLNREEYIYIYDNGLRCSIVYNVWKMNDLLFTSENRRLNFQFFFQHQ